MAYTSKAIVKAELNITTTGTDGLIDTLIAEAQGEIDSACGRTFEAVTATRTYDPARVCDNTLWLDGELLTVTTLTNGDSSVIPSDQYWLLPLNFSPKYAIKLKSTSLWQLGTIDSVISVAGTWGYTATCPSAIATLCKELTIYKFRQKDVPTYGVTAMPDGGQIVVDKGYPASWPRIVAAFRRRSL